MELLGTKYIGDQKNGRFLYILQHLLIDVGKRVKGNIYLQTEIGMKENLKMECNDI